jgi:predicted heme/steroid binding protein
MLRRFLNETNFANFSYYYVRKGNKYMGGFFKNFSAPNALLAIFIGVSLVVFSAAASGSFHSPSDGGVSKNTPIQTQQQQIVPVTESQTVSQSATEGKTAAQSQTVERANISAIGGSADTETKTPNSSPVTETATASPVLVDFTTQTLASHNKAGDCYVAYQGDVYNVSAQPAWSTCNYDGVLGGADVTLSFPQAANYFSSLPLVGNYTNTDTVANNNNNIVSNNISNVNSTSATSTHFSVSGNGGDDGSWDDNRGDDGGGDN